MTAANKVWLSLNRLDLRISGEVHYTITRISWRDPLLCQLGISGEIHYITRISGEIHYINRISGEIHYRRVKANRALAFRGADNR